MFDTDSIGAAAIGLGIIAASAYNGWQSVQAKREARRATVQAGRAADNAHPVSNGWGTKVAGDLAYLRDSMDRAHRRLDGIDARQTYADQRVGGLAERVNEGAAHARTAAEQSAAVATGLAAHLADHTKADLERAAS